mmetsp:Transcript_33072/g.81130  ORF Transcript_33072/g.81130 Transcript_33072/m.81130 type:complete len:139 (+) Transcript_33072:274-690(+)
MNSKIREVADQMNPVAVKKGNRFEARVESLAEFERTVKDDWKTLNELMVRQRRIKAALVLANAETVVTVAGEERAVAEAIERKNLASEEACMISTLRRKLREATTEVDRHNEAMNVRLNKLLETTYAKKESVVRRIMT